MSVATLPLGAPRVKWLVGLKLQTALVAYQGMEGVISFTFHSYLYMAFHKCCRFCSQPLGIYKIYINRHLVSL